MLLEVPDKTRLLPFQRTAPSSSRTFAQCRIILTYALTSVRESCYRIISADEYCTIWMEQIKKMDKIDKGFRVSVGTSKAGVPVKDLDKEVNWCHALLLLREEIRNQTHSQP